MHQGSFKTFVRADVVGKELMSPYNNVGLGGGALTLRSDILILVVQLTTITTQLLTFALATDQLLSLSEEGA